MSQLQSTIPGRLIARIPAKIIFINDIDFKQITYDHIKYKYIQFKKIYAVPHYVSMIRDSYKSNLPFRFELAKNVELERDRDYIISVFEDTTGFVSLSLTPIANEAGYKLYLYQFLGKNTRKVPSYRYSYIMFNNMPRALFVKQSVSKGGTHFSYQLAILSTETPTVLVVEKTSRGNLNILRIYPSREMIYTTAFGKELKRLMKIQELAPLMPELMDIDKVKILQQQIEEKEREFTIKLNELLNNKFVLKLEDSFSVTTSTTQWWEI